MHHRTGGENNKNASIEKEARTQELKGYARIVEVRIEEAQKLTNDVGEAWTNMEDINDLVKIREQLQAM